MATRTIQSPGFEARERDLSPIPQTNVGTNVFIAGYTQSGPVDEVLNISSLDELKAIYGTPTNSAERYFYHGVRELLTSPATIYTYRLPYGAGTGVGFGSQYSALVYPVNFVKSDRSTVTTDLNQLSGTYVLGAPVQFTLSETDYIAAKDGSLFTWAQSGCSRAQLSATSELGKAGLIVLNKAQTTINNQFEGYYVAIADNTNINPASNFDSVLGVNTLSQSATYTQNYTSVPSGTLEFSLSSTYANRSSISYVMENLTDYNIDGRDDDDLLNVGVFKIRKSLYATQAYKLDYVLEGAIVGSIDNYRQRLNPKGGPQTSFFLENVDDNDINVEILVNPYVSNKFGNTAVGVDGIPTKKVRVLTQNIPTTTISGLSSNTIPTLSAAIGYADALFPVGTYSSAQITSKELGSIPSKIERALESVKNDEIYDIDVVVEAGLGTIWTATQSNTSLSTFYDETAQYPALTALATSNALDAAGENIRANYSTIFNVFENFCNLPSNTNGRGDVFFIADPIRQIMITGKNTKVLSDKSKSFQQYIYWATRHQFELENTSYAATYTNWAQTYDEFLGEKVWVPFSSVAAAIFARNDAAEFPWFASAGFNRGLVGSTVVDLAITPNQKQRDELYKSNLNPVLFSPSQGMAIFGQKTLQRKPSAFDRINVRRLFQYLERATKKACMFYIFEPNDEFTRTRLSNTLSPIFDYVKNNRGLDSFLIVCDTRNNTPDVIDNNELKVDLYLKPIRSAEFIIATFTAVRSGTSFTEVI